MDHENAKSSQSQSAKEKPARSKLERAIVWTVIGLMILVTGAEALARVGYSKTLAALEENIEESKEPLSMADFKSNIKNGLAIQGKGDREGKPTIMFKWPSLLKRYELHLTATSDEEQILTSYSTNDEPAALIGQGSKDGEGEDTDDLGGGGAPGMGSEQEGGPRGGEGGRPRSGGRGRPSAVGDGQDSSAENNSGTEQ